MSYGASTIEETTPSLQLPGHVAFFVRILAGPGTGTLFVANVARSRMRRVVIGRSSKADISLDDLDVSRSHCEIVASPRLPVEGMTYGLEYRLTDLGSANGTYVNGEALVTAELQHGDLIQVGRSMLQFIAGPEVQTHYVL